MLRVFRSLVLWLMALAIPLQGMATGTMAHCPPAPQAAAAPGLSQGPAASHLHPPAAAVMTAPGSADHGMHHGSAGHRVADHPGQEDAAAHGAAGHSMLKCCSVACSMAAGTVPTLAVQVQARSPAPLQPVAQFYRGVALDGPDRPPKTHLA